MFGAQGLVESIRALEDDPEGKLRSCDPEPIMVTETKQSDSGNTKLTAPLPCFGCKASKMECSLLFGGILRLTEFLEPA